MSNTSFIIQHFADKVLWKSGAGLSAPEPEMFPGRIQVTLGL